MSKKKQDRPAPFSALVATKHPDYVTAWLNPRAKMTLSTYERSGYIAAQVANLGRTPAVAVQRANLLEKSLGEEILRAARVSLKIEVQRVIWHEDGPGALNRPYPGETYCDWRNLRTVARFESGVRAIGGMFPTMEEHLEQQAADAERFRAGMDPAALPVGVGRFEDGHIMVQDADGKWLDVSGVTAAQPTFAPEPEPEVWVPVATMAPTRAEVKVVFRDAEGEEILAHWCDRAYDGSDTGTEGWAASGDGCLSLIPGDFEAWRIP